MMELFIHDLTPMLAWLIPISERSQVDNQNLMICGSAMIIISLRSDLALKHLAVYQLIILVESVRRDW